MELLEKLGIQPALLVAQIINFLILLFILYKFLYNPVLAILKKREDKIKQSIKDADDISKKLADMEVRYDEKIKKAKQEALEILEKSEQEGLKQKQETISKTKKEVANIISKAKEEITKEKEKMVEDLQKETGQLVVVALRKILSEDKFKAIDKKSIEETVRNL